MKIGFLSGSLAQIGSGQQIVLPLATQLNQLGHTTVGLEATRWRRHTRSVGGLSIDHEPLIRHPRRSVEAVHRAAHHHQVERLNLDALYAFHNTNALRVLHQWPHPTRLLIMNLIGFGIDRASGGFRDTFPLQSPIFAHPYWDLHIVATQNEYDGYASVYEQLDIDVSKLMLLPHGFDESKYYPQESPPPTASFVLCPVNVYPRKNLELAIAAFAQTNAVEQLVVTGEVWDEAYHVQLMTIAQQLGVAQRVIFLGGVDSAELTKLYRQASAVLFTSHRETFGLGIIEALACGTPALVPDWLVPCREIASHVVGAIPIKRDAAQIAAALDSLTQRQFENSATAESVRNRFSNATVAATLHATLEDLHERKQARHRRLSALNWRTFQEQTIV